MEIVSEIIFDELVKFNGEPTLIVVSEKMMKFLVEQITDVSNVKMKDVGNFKFSGIRMIRSKDLQKNEILIK
jgi:hypothetical protein